MAQQDAEIAALKRAAQPKLPHGKWGSDRCIVGGRDATAKTPSVAYRRAGDDYLLVEYGPIVLDLDLRFRAHALMQAVGRAMDAATSPASSTSRRASARCRSTTTRRRCRSRI